MIKVVKSNPKTAVLGNKRREEGRELFSVKDVSSEDIVSIRRKNWLEVVIECFR